MKPKSDFVVEIKKNRRLDTKQNKRSLWAGVDLEEAHRQETDQFAPALVRPRNDAGQIDTAGPDAATPQQARILPNVTERAIPEDHTAPVEKTKSNAGILEQNDDGRLDRRRHRRRQPLLRRWRQKPLPPGQRWKHRLPRILQEKN